MNRELLSQKLKELRIVNNFIRRIMLRQLSALSARPTATMRPAGVYPMQKFCISFRDFIIFLWMICFI